MYSSGAQRTNISADEHVPEIERFIRTLKEHIRALRASLPYEKIPHRLVLALVRHSSRWLNVFCPKNSLSQVVSPRVIMTGRKIDYSKHCKLEVGSYVQTHEKTQPRNDTNQMRTTGAIALESNDNDQGGYKFLSLTTGNELTRGLKQFTPLPMTEDVIQRVH